MHMPWKRLMLTCCCAALFAGADLSCSQPAQAQISIGGFGISIGGLIGGGRYSGSRSRTGTRSKKTSDDSSSSSDNSEPSSRKDRKDQVLASKGAPAAKDQVTILQYVASSEVLGVVGSTKDLEQVGQAFSKEDARDYTGRIKDILDKFRKEQDKGKNSRPGDVTEQAMEQSLEKAFASAKLDTFETFLGENWSVERLRVMILELVSNELGRLFDGNNRGNAPMLALDNLIQRSAQSVYRRTFEMSELLAANRSATLFVQRLYQTHGDLLDDRTREGADGMITQAANAAVAKLDGLLRRDENGFALRYRAQRIVFDCLSDNVQQVSSSDTTIRTVSEIEQKVATTGGTTCIRWLDRQFGTQLAGRDNQIDRARLTPQQPVPMRAIWSAEGPTFDASMFGRASGAF
jgi:hypothetical protein